MKAARHPSSVFDRYRYEGDVATSGLRIPAGVSLKGREPSVGEIRSRYSHSSYSDATVLVSSATTKRVTFETMGLVKTLPLLDFLLTYQYLVKEAPKKS